jgi:hypothetical protein
MARLYFLWLKWSCAHYCASLDSNHESSSFVQKTLMKTPCRNKLTHAIYRREFQDEISVSIPVCASASLTIAAPDAHEMEVILASTPIWATWFPQSCIQQLQPTLCSFQELPWFYLQPAYRPLPTHLHPLQHVSGRAQRSVRARALSAHVKALQWLSLQHTRLISTSMTMPCFSEGLIPAVLL